MDKERLVKMARASGIALQKQVDGSYLLFPTTKRFADMIESALAHKYDEVRKKDQSNLTALRHQVHNLAGENIKLRASISNARQCLDEVSNG